MPIGFPRRHKGALGSRVPPGRSTAWRQQDGGLVWSPALSATHFGSLLEPQYAERLFLKLLETG